MTGANAAEAAARRIGGWLLGPHRDILAGCERIVFSPDRELCPVPLEALWLPGEAGCLCRRHTVSYAPCATMWAAARSLRARTEPESPARLLVVAASRNADGEALPGTTLEARELARHYLGVELKIDDPSSLDLGRRASSSRYEALHLATHSEVDDQYPWRSGLLLDPGQAATGGGWLRAERIARLSLEERLVVLSSCSSGSGRTMFGEGVEGLTDAFLAAGVTAVVSSLWPVDDATTAELMALFYGGLCRGHTAEAALRGAKLELARRPRTRQPFYWAPFVLTGDGQVGLRLREATPARAGQRN
jgi:CHAT domain-containing protein